MGQMEVLEWNSVPVFQKMVYVASYLVINLFCIYTPIAGYSVIDCLDGVSVITLEK